MGSFAQAEGQLAAAAPRQTMPGLGLAIAVDLETATGALQAPAKLQQVPADRPLLRTTALLPRRLRRRYVVGTVTVSREEISSRVSFSLGLDRPSSTFLFVMFPQSQSPLISVSLVWFGQPPLSKVVTSAANDRVPQLTQCSPYSSFAQRHHTFDVDFDMPCGLPCQ